MAPPASPHDTGEGRVIGDRRGRQRPEVRALLGEPPGRGPIPLSLNHRAGEGFVARPVRKVGMPPQEQRLLNGGPRPVMRLLDDAVFVGRRGLNPGGLQTVVIEHALEAHREVPAAASLELVCCREQIIVAQDARHHAQGSERALRARDQRYKRLTRRRRDIRPSAETSTHSNHRC